MKYNFKNVRMLALDFDGVMTDDSVIVGSNGEEFVTCSRSDGLGIENIKKRGILVMVISKEKNSVVEARCKKLGVECLHGVEDKTAVLRRAAERNNLLMSQVCYIGNDINDIGCIKEAGIGVAVPDSHKKVIEAAGYITKARGGRGAVREICDLILG